MGFHRTVVKQFLCLLLPLYDKYNLNSDNIYNVDETGISTVPSKQIKVFGLSGKRQVGGLSSAERSVLVTAEIYMSAFGNFVPMMFVFPRARENTEISRFTSLILSSRTARKAKTRKMKVNFPLLPEKRHREQRSICERNKLVFAKNGSKLKNRY
jgi:hypothetical protein